MSSYFAHMASGVIAVASRFNGAINAQDIEGLAGMMTDVAQWRVVDTQRTRERLQV